MKNVNDSTKDSGLGMSITSQRKTNNTNTGAGANANSMADIMDFVGSDRLAELVWSPQTGLKIKFAEKEPWNMREAGPSETEFLDTQNEEHIASIATLDVSDEVVKSSTCTHSQNQGVADTLFQRLFDNGMTSNVEDSSFESRLCIKTEPVMQCEPRKHVESVSFLTKRKSEWSLEQHLLLRNKRIKKQANEYATKTDNSFTKWISNMVKGFKSHNICDQRINVNNETRCLVSKETGFQNVFQSLFLPGTITRIGNESIGNFVLAKRCCQESFDYMEMENKKAESLVKQVNLYEAVRIDAPNGMFDTVRRLRLSRTDIHKWMNSQLPVSQLDGFFLRLRVTKWEEETGGSRYYVACITGLQRETPLNDLKQPIRVEVGGVECFVESQHVSNCDFIEDELTAWWQKTSKNQRIPVVKDLKSKLALRRALACSSSVDGNSLLIKCS